MPEVLVPLPFAELPTKPPITARIRLSEEMQQVLSLLSGYDGASRRLLRCTETGILQTVNPLLQGFINVGDEGAAYDYQGPDVKCTEVVVRSNPNNVGEVWVNVYAAAAVDTGWPLDTGEYIPLTITNLNHLHVHIVTAAEKVIIEYTL